MGGLARNALQPGGPDRMGNARAAVLAKFEAAVEAVEPGLPLYERRKRAERLRAAWLGSVAYQSARKRRGEPYLRLELDSWLAERVAVATRPATTSARAARAAARMAGETTNGTASLVPEAVPSEERDAGAPSHGGP